MSVISKTVREDAVELAVRRWALSPVFSRAKRGQQGGEADLSLIVFIHEQHKRFESRSGAIG
jgi:hypothetical protein